MVGADALELAGFVAANRAPTCDAWGALGGWQPWGAPWPFAPTSSPSSKKLKWTLRVASPAVGSHDFRGSTPGTQ